MLPSRTTRAARRTACFNPHPARRPGAAASRPRTPPPVTHSFNPHPARRPGAAAICPSFAWRASRFQSSPGPEAGCCHAADRSHALVDEFQSSPGPEAGCCITREEWHERVRALVSILTRPGGRVLQAAMRDRRRPGVLVSILTRPGGRVLLLEAAPTTARLSAGFNPHPARRPGAARRRRPSALLLRVSILTRPGGRVLPAGARLRCRDTTCFNPHPARRPGAASGDSWRSRMALTPFQSSPGPEAGCCSRRDPATILHSKFQSSPGPEAGCCQQVPQRHARNGIVSILTRPGGRVLRGAARSARRRCGTCFNPHPARRPGAAAAAAAPMGKAEQVSILTRPGGRVLLRR